MTEISATNNTATMCHKHAHRRQIIRPRHWSQASCTAHEHFQMQLQPAKPSAPNEPTTTSIQFAFVKIAYARYLRTNTHFATRHLCLARCINLKSKIAIGPVAQWIRHRPMEPGIAGSSPARVSVHIDFNSRLSNMT